MTRALQVSEADMMGLLEKEYTLKLSGRLGIQQNTFGGQSHGGAVIIPMNGQLGASQPQMTVSNHDYEFMRSLYEAYKSADSKTRQTFTGICETVLNLSGRNTQQPSSQSAVVVAAASSGIAAERP